MTAAAAKCVHCKLEIKPILDPWGHDNWRGQKYGWYHVAATDNHSEGKYATTCPDDSGEEATPEAI